MDELNKELLQSIKTMDISGISVQEKPYTPETASEVNVVTGNDHNTNIGTGNGGAREVVMEEDTTAVGPEMSHEPNQTVLPQMSDSMGGEPSSVGFTPPKFNNTTVIFMLGMAGSGKTTFTQRLTAHFLAQGKKPYILNFDPACEDPPFPVNIDIRDTVDYKKVMQQYNLGPNGGIVTALNLFTTIFDQVLDIVKSRAKSHEFILVDTPGQLECFLWSASGQIILHSFAALFPTIVTYVTDLTICKNPISFASNMMYGVTILYKSKLPMIIVLNKADLEPGMGQTVSSWITDFELLEAALRAKEGYSCNLASSLALALDEFYSVVDHCVVSAFDGFGFKDYETLVFKGIEAYGRDYAQMYQGMKKDYHKKMEKQKETDLARFKKDFQSGSRNETFSMQATATLSQGIDLLPHDSDEELTSDESEEDDETNEDADTIGDYRTKESVKREAKRMATSLPGTSSSSHPPQL